MATCRICGTGFDELRYQVIVPGRAESFDRIDCAVVGATVPLAVDDAGEPVALTRDLEAALLAPLLKRLALPGAALFATASLAAASAYVWGPSGAGPRERERPFAMAEPLQLPLPRFLAGSRPASKDVALAADRRRDASRVGAGRPPRVQANPFALPASLDATSPSGPASPPRGAPSSPPAASSAGPRPPVRPQPSSGAPTSPLPGSPPRPELPTAAPAPPHPTGAAEPQADPKKSDDTRPGWGHGDPNHTHTGPPGRGAEKEGKKAAKP